MALSPWSYVFLAASFGATIIATAQRFRYKYIPTEKRRRSYYDECSGYYDRQIYRFEFVYGVLLYRGRLIPKAEGHVLEIGAGTGRNFKYLNSQKVKTLTCADFSRPMLRVAREKQKEILKDIPCRFFHVNVMKLPFPDECFDTLIDTLSLCSYERPVDSFREALRCLKGGKILLIEHGLSNWAPIAKIQEVYIARYAHVWGCFNTRDIIQLLKVFENEIQIVKIKSRRFGTYHMIEAVKIASPKKDATKNEDVIKDETLLDQQQQHEQEI